MVKLNCKILLVIIIVLQMSCAGLEIVEDRGNKKSSTNKTISSLSYNISIPYVRSVPTPIDLNRICKTGYKFRKVYTSNNLITGIVPSITLGIVHPQKVTTVCSKR